jgi:hypothetical protein
MAFSDNVVSGITSSVGTPSLSTLTERFGSQFDSFLGDISRLESQEANWNKTFPYQIVVLRSNETLGQYSIHDNWQVTLPINPEQLQITTPFAVSTAVTLGGIIEQHNGAPIRMITLSGTTGVYPLRGSGDSLASFNPLEAIFSGTIARFQNTVSSLKSVITGNPPTSPNLYADEIGTQQGIQAKGTGYYQFHLLSRMFEYYVSAVKQPKNRDLRLCLMIWKDQAAYLVSPVQFTLNRSVDSPHEYRYTIVLKAWKRISTESIGKLVTNRPAARKKRDPNLLAQVLNRIQYARNTLQEGRQTILAIGPDFDQSVGEVLRETALLIKDGIGLAKTAADFPAKIQESMKDTIVKNSQAIVDALSGSEAEGDPQVRDQLNTIKSSANSQKSKLSSATDPSDPTGKIFKNPNDSFKLFNNIKMDLLNPSSTVRDQIEAERLRVQQLTRHDFEKRRDQIMTFAANYAARVGAGNETYDRIYNRDDLTSIRETTDQDYAILAALNDAIMQMGRLAAYSDSNPQSNFVTGIEVVAGLAARSGVAFQKPVSKFAVPMPYGFSLEQLSLRYLRDANRWHEIATLNGLREPYVDEVGFDLELLTNAGSNYVTVSDVSNLYLGQPVTLYSNLESFRQAHHDGVTGGILKCRIVSITKIADEYYRVELDTTGTDISVFTTTAESKLHAFLPGTVNSQQIIYIPSDRPSTQEDTSKSVPGVNDFDHMLALGGVDLLLDKDGDLVITPDGEAKLAFGLTNLVQYVRISLSTMKGSLLQHPDFGLEIQPGLSHADFTAKDLLQSVKGMFRNDPAFTGVQAASVLKQGAATQLTIAIGIAGYDQLVPITLDVLGT